MNTTESVRTGIITAGIALVCALALSACAAETAAATPGAQATGIAEPGTSFDAETTRPLDLLSTHPASDESWAERIREVRAACLVGRYGRDYTQQATASSLPDDPRFVLYAGALDRSVVSRTIAATGPSIAALCAALEARGVETDRGQPDRVAPVPLPLALHGMVTGCLQYRLVDAMSFWRVACVSWEDLPAQIALHPSPDHPAMSPERDTSSEPARDDAGDR